MGEKRKILERIPFTMDLPGETIPGVPLLEIAGDGRVLIENHRGVLQYGETEIRIRVKFGQIHICGCGLRLAQMTKHQLIIIGRIDAVQLCRGGR